MYHSLLVIVVFIYFYDPQYFHLSCMYLVLPLFLQVSYGHIMYTLQMASKILSQCFFHDISVKSNCHNHTAALLPPLSYIISTLFPYYLFFKHTMNYSTHTHTHICMENNAAYYLHYYCLHMIHCIQSA